MKILCPAYKSDNPDPCKMAVSKALHENCRLQYRIKAIDYGEEIVDSEMVIENNVLKGKIDDVFKTPNGVIVIDYISSRIPPTYKLIDSAISAGFLRYEYKTDASARVVFYGGVIDVPNGLVEDTWWTLMSEGFLKILSLSDDEQLKYANPASEICIYCANKECTRRPIYIANY